MAKKNRRTGGGGSVNFAATPPPPPAAPAPPPPPKVVPKKHWPIRIIVVALGIAFFWNYFGGPKIGKKGGESEPNSNSTVFEDTAFKVGVLAGRIKTGFDTTFRPPKEPTVLKTPQTRYVSYAFEKGRAVDMRSVGVLTDGYLDIEFATEKAHATVYQTFGDGSNRELFCDDLYWYIVKGPVKEQLGSGQGLMKNMTEMKIRLDRDEVLKFRIVENRSRIFD